MFCEIQFKQLFFAYKDNLALKGIDFTFKKGQYHVLFGPNGSGKSTLLGLLCTALKMQKGSFLLDGQSLNLKMLLKYKSRIAMSFQSPSLDPLLSVYENLWCFGRLMKVEKQALQSNIEDQLDRFNLQDKKNIAFKNLSGGMKRKVEIIKALLPDIDFLFLDEPCASLDPEARFDIWHMLQNIKQSGIGLLVSTHLLNDYHAVDECSFLKEGEIVRNIKVNDFFKQLGENIIDVKLENIDAKFLKTLEDNAVDVLFHSNKHFLLNYDSKNKLEAILNNYKNINEVLYKKTNLMDAYRIIMQESGSH